MQNIILAIIGAVSLIINNTPAVKPAPMATTSLPVLTTITSTTPLVVETITSVLNLQQLERIRPDMPVGDITQYMTTNSWAQVILIPQSHRYPGSNASDKTNDKAEKVQNQIYDIISQVNKKLKINFVMTEGDLYGEVPDEKIQTLADQISNRKKLVQQKNNLKNADENSRLSKQLNNSIKKIDREIILKGAPYKLKAEGADITIFGAENLSTREKSAKIVRNYIYIKDRIGQLNKKSIYSSGVKLSNSYSLPELLLKLREARSKKTQEKKSTTNKVLPSRQDNPYKTINDKNKLNGLLNKAENEINTVVLNERNKDAAENFSKALKENEMNTGIIQYGAEHEKGLTEELNKRGISVFVVKPELIK